MSTFIFCSSRVSWILWLDFSKAAVVKQVLAEQMEQLPEETRSTHPMKGLLDALETPIPPVEGNLDTLKTAANIRLFEKIAYEKRPSGVYYSFRSLGSLEELQAHVQEKLATAKQETLYDEVFARFLHESEEHGVQMERAMPLLRAYMERYDPEQHHPASFFINPLLGISGDVLKDQEDRLGLYSLLKETGFLRPSSVVEEDKIPLAYDPKHAVRGFIRERGNFDTLILGNGYALDGATSVLLGVRQVGCGAEKVTLEDLQAKALWVDINCKSEPDIMGDMHSPALYEAIRQAQGEKSLKRISERGWESGNLSPEILSHIKSLLRDDGVFEVLDFGLVGREQISDTLDAVRHQNADLISKLEKAGLTYTGCDFERKALLFKPN